MQAAADAMDWALGRKPASQVCVEILGHVVGQLRRSAPVRAKHDALTCTNSARSEEVEPPAF
jgi:hypothetical protein